MQQSFSPLVCLTLSAPHLYTQLKQTQLQSFNFTNTNTIIIPLSLIVHELMLGSDYRNSARFWHDVVVANKFSASAPNMNAGDTNGPWSATIKNSIVASGTLHDTQTKSLAC